MSTLDTLALQNFQSISSAEVEFAPGLNVIVGPSNLGKSAILRALKMLVRNGPSTGLVRKGKAKFIAAARFSDGVTLTLHKGAKDSVYILNAPGKPEIVNSKSGVKAPDEVEQLWHMPITEDKDLCFASQHEPPFLLAEPGSAVAKVLGDLTQASKLMAAVGLANKKRLSASNEVKVREREQLELRAELEKLEFDAERTNLVFKAQKAYEKAQSVQSKLDSFAALAQQYVSKRNALETLETEVPKVDAILIDKATEAVYTMTALSDLIEKNEALSSRIDSLSVGVVLLEKQKAEAEKELAEYRICPTCGQKVPEYDNWA